MVNSKTNNNPTIAGVKRARPVDDYTSIPTSTAATEIVVLRHLPTSTPAISLKPTTSPESHHEPSTSNNREKSL